ncbi:hypothetical protein VN0448_15100 [Helicobacter pylori]|nr:hypothetical protein VN0448_15100 [Helicobacter pylori]
MWLQDSYPAAFSLKLMLKDIRLASNEVGEAIKLPFLFKAQELYPQAKIRFKRIGYGSRLLLSFIII